MKTFKILRKDYYNKNGIIDASRGYYYIKQFKGQYDLILFKFEYWKTIKHEECSWGDCSKVPTTFNTISAAEDFINEILTNEMPRQKWVKKNVKIIEYKNE